VINGIPYSVAGDTNATQIFTRWENTSIPSSGASMRKMVRRSPNTEAMTLLTDADERAQLKTDSESKDDVSLYWVNAAGDAYRAEGWFEVESNESEENRTNVILQPRDDWTVTVGEE
jgi:hypothetical protein